jgi:Flp pilus assembly protein TadG
MLRRLTVLRRDAAGTAIIEFAIALPVLLLAVLGTFQFGLTLNNYLMLTDAVRVGARQLALSRGSSTPKTDTVNGIYNSAPNLTQANVTVTLTVNGATCNSDAGCQTLLTSAEGQSASVSATYPCSLQVMNYDFAPSCTLSAQTTERIE